MNHSSSSSVPSTDETIRFSSRDTSLGRLIVAESANGLCAATLGESLEQVKADLQARFHLETRFSQARWLEGGESTGRLAEEVCRIIESPAENFRGRLDLRGTPFQLRVWAALREIPAGETRSYKQLAESLGIPGAVRAIGSACGANPLAVIVPCHRAVRQDGKPSGYRWGLKRKQALLRKESGLRRTAV